MTAVLAQDIPPCAFTTVSDVQAACDQIRRRLAAAAMHGDVPAICGCRTAAEDVRVAVRDARLGADARLAVAELQRRGERVFGVALRRGQADGTIRSNGRYSPVTAGLPTATDYASRNDLYAGGNGRSAGIYDLTDGVTDEEFEAALAAGRADGVLSRVSVARRLGFDREPAAGAGQDEGVPAADDRSFAAVSRRLELLRLMADAGHTSRQIGDRLGREPGYVRDVARREGIVIAGDQVTRKRRDLDSARIVEKTVAALAGLAMGAELVDPADLDPALTEGWVTSLTHSIRALNQMTKAIAKVKEINP